MIAKYSSEIDEDQQSISFSENINLPIDFHSLQIWLLPKKNFAPNRWTHNGNQKLVGMQLNPMIIVWMYTLLSIEGPPQYSSTSVLNFDYLIMLFIFVLTLTKFELVDYPFWFASRTTEDTSHTDADLFAFLLSNSSKR